MFSIRNVGGVSLFLFGTKFLWLIPVYAPAGIDTSGVAWVTTGALAVAVIIFTRAAAPELSRAESGGL